MLTVGGQEMIVIVLLALLLFGPKELPKIARTLGKAMTEFRRAQNELKTTFNREMQNLERESGVHEIVATTNNYLTESSYNYEPTEPGDYGDDYYNSGSDTNTYETDASATEGVEFVAEPLQIEASADSVPHNGHVYDAGHAEAVHADAPEPAASIHNEAGHEPVHT